MLPILFIFAAIAFVARGQCPQAAGTNVVVNSGFESHQNSVEPWVVTQEAPGRPPKAGLTNPGYHSRRAFGTGPPRTRSQRFVGLSQEIVTCPKQAYIFEFYYKFVETMYPNQGIIYAPLGDLFQAIPNSPARINNTWHQFRQYVQNGTAVDFTLDLSGSRMNEVYIDTVKVIAQSAVKAKPGAPNHLRNPGFESGQFAPWISSQTEGCYVGSPGRRSNIAFHCHLPQSSQSYPVAKITQSVTTVVNRRYILSFDYKYKTSNSGTKCQIAFGLGDDLSTYPDIQQPTEGRQGFWYHYEHGIIAQATTTDLFFQIASYASMGACNASVDNVSFRQAL